MKDRKKIFNDLISKIGLDRTSNMTGLSKLDLIRRSDCYIDLSIANNIIPDLFREELFPRKYKNCEIIYDSFAGTVDWYCNWSDDNWRDYKEETTYSYATPFWDINDGIPVNTNSYDGVDFFSGKFSFTEGDLNDNEIFSFIKWKDGFENLASYDRWIRRFYLPQVHTEIQKHLDNYRNYSFR